MVVFEILLGPQTINTCVPLGLPAALMLLAIQAKGAEFIQQMFMKHLP